MSLPDSPHSLAFSREFWHGICAVLPQGAASWLEVSWGRGIYFRSLFRIVFLHIMFYRESPTGPLKTPDSGTASQEPKSENSSNHSSPEMPTTKNR